MALSTNQPLSSPHALPSLPVADASATPPRPPQGPVAPTPIAAQVAPPSPKPAGSPTPTLPLAPAPAAAGSPKAVGQSSPGKARVDATEAMSEAEMLQLALTMSKSTGTVEKKTDGKQNKQVVAAPSNSKDVAPTAPGKATVDVPGLLTEAEMLEVALAMSRSTDTVKTTTDRKQSSCIKRIEKVCCPRSFVPVERLFRR